MKTRILLAVFLFITIVACNPDPCADFFPFPEELYIEILDANGNNLVLNGTYDANNINVIANGELIGNEYAVSDSLIIIDEWSLSESNTLYIELSETETDTIEANYQIVENPCSDRYILLSATCNGNELPIVDFAGNQKISFVK